MSIQKKGNFKTKVNNNQIPLTEEGIVNLTPFMFSIEIENHTLNFEIRQLNMKEYSELYQYITILNKLDENAHLIERQTVLFKTLIESLLRLISCNEKHLLFDRRLLNIHEKQHIEEITDKDKDYILDILLKIENESVYRPALGKSKGLTKVLKLHSIRSSFRKSSIGYLKAKIEQIFREDMKELLEHLAINDLLLITRKALEYNISFKKKILQDIENLRLTL